MTPKTADLSTVAPSPASSAPSTQRAIDAMRTRLHPLIPFDPAREIAAATGWLAQKLAQAQQKRFVMGLSGGIDSAVVGTLAAKAVGADRVLYVAMPYGLISKPRHGAPSTDASLDDARAVVRSIPGATLHTVDITPMVDAMVDAQLALHQSGSLGVQNSGHFPTDRATFDLCLGNAKARMRAVTLRFLANAQQGLVLGTENRTENLLGYFTIGGDEETDLEVLSPYLKVHVRALAEALGVPESVRTKAPSADLWAGQTDEGELGFTYDRADAVLWVTDGHATHEARAIEHWGCPAEDVRLVHERVRKTEFKRAGRPTFEGAVGSEA